MITYEEKQYRPEAGESVLDCLLRSGINAPHSCKAGTCQSCMMKIVEGEVPEKSQQGLKETYAAKGYFLPCLAKAQEPLTVAALSSDDDVLVDGTIVCREMISESVLKVRIVVASNFKYEPGQFISLVRGDGLSRCYSIASIPDVDGHELELHVRLIPGGKMSSWLADELSENQTVKIKGPAGECFYLNKPEEDILMIGTGTGLAPLYGILRQALQARHQASITLHHGGVDPKGLYLRDELKALSAEYEQFNYAPCVLNDPDADDVAQGLIDEVVLSRHEDLSKYRIYLCGDPGIVNTLRKKLFLGGAGMKKIHADPFTAAGS